MPKPSGDELAAFSYQRIWELVVTSAVPDRLNARTELVSFLTAKGHVKIIAEEFAEKNIGRLLTNVERVCEQWEALGIPRPLYLNDQMGTIITWKHPKYQNISGRQPLSPEFCAVWQWVKSCRERDFLFCCAAYLFQLGCGRIYVTDTRGDGGIDLIGVHDAGPLRGICFFVQAKTAGGEVGKESLYSEYTKFLLLRFNSRWHEYQRAAGLDNVSDGVGLVYLFASNQEFNPAVMQAARDLPIMLRSGRQIAHCLAARADVSRWMAVRDIVGEMKANTSRNLQIAISKAL